MTKKHLAATQICRAASLVEDITATFDKAYVTGRFDGSGGKGKIAANNKTPPSEAMGRS